MASSEKIVLRTERKTADGSCVLASISERAEVEDAEAVLIGYQWIDAESDEKVSSVFGTESTSLHWLDGYETGASVEE